MQVLKMLLCVLHGVMANVLELLTPYLPGYYVLLLCYVYTVHTNYTLNQELFFISIVHNLLKNLNVVV